MHDSKFLKEENEAGIFFCSNTCHACVRLAEGGLGQCLRRVISGTRTWVLSQMLLPSHVHSMNK